MKWRMSGSRPTGNPRGAVTMTGNGRRKCGRSVCSQASTGEPGGKETGQSVSHYIIPGGRYAKAYAKLAEQGFQLHWQSIPVSEQARAKKSSKTKFTCPDLRTECLGEARGLVNLWRVHEANGSARHQQRSYLTLPKSLRIYHVTPLYAGKMRLFAIPYSLGHLSTLHLFWELLGLPGAFFIAIPEGGLPSTTPSLLTISLALLSIFLYFYSFRF